MRRTVEERRARLQELAARHVAQGGVLHAQLDDRVVVGSAPPAQDRRCIITVDEYGEAVYHAPDGRPMTAEEVAAVNGPARRGSTPTQQTVKSLVFWLVLLLIGVLVFYALEGR